MKPKVIITSCLYDDIEINYYIYATVGKIKKIVNLQWEQVLSMKWEKNQFHTPRNSAARATHICWGEKSFERLNKAGVENAIITGPIHMDFLREEFNKYFMTKDELMEQYNLNKRNKVVLYISSFTLASMSEDDVKSLEDRVSMGMGDFRNAMIQSKKGTLEWIDKLLSCRGDITFIYRPHPNEQNDIAIENMKKKYMNFKVISDYSVVQWIKVSDKVFTWISTSIVEAFFAGKYCGILRPVKLNEDLDMVIYKNADIISDYNDMLEAINDDKLTCSLDIELLKSHYAFDINMPSFIKICDLIENVINTDEFDMEPYRGSWTSVKHAMRALVHELICQINLLRRNDVLSNRKGNSYIKKIRHARAQHEHDIAGSHEIGEILLKIKNII